MENHETETATPEKTSYQPPPVETSDIVLLDKNDQPVRTVPNPNHPQVWLRIAIDGQLFERAGADDDGRPTYRPS